MDGIGGLLGTALMVVVGGAFGWAYGAARYEAGIALDRGDLDAYEAKMRDVGTLMEAFMAIGIEPQV